MRLVFLLVSINSLDLYDFLESVSSSEEECTLEDFFDLTVLLRFFFSSNEEEEVLRCRFLRIFETSSCKVSIGVFSYSDSVV